MKTLIENLVETYEYSVTIPVIEINTDPDDSLNISILSNPEYSNQILSSISEIFNGYDALKYVETPELSSKLVVSEFPLSMDPITNSLIMSFTSSEKLSSNELLEIKNSINNYIDAEVSYDYALISTTIGEYEIQLSHVTDIDEEFTIELENTQLTESSDEEFEYIEESDFIDTDDIFYQLDNITDEEEYESAVSQIFVGDETVHEYRHATAKEEYLTVRLLNLQHPDRWAKAIKDPSYEAELADIVRVPDKYDSCRYNYEVSNVKIIDDHTVEFNIDITPNWEDLEDANDLIYPDDYPDAYRDL